MATLYIIILNLFAGSLTFADEKDFSWFVGPYAWIIQGSCASKPKTHLCNGTVKYVSFTKGPDTYMGGLVDVASAISLYSGAYCAGTSDACPSAENCFRSQTSKNSKVWARTRISNGSEKEEVQASDGLYYRWALPPDQMRVDTGCSNDKERYRNFCSGIVLVSNSSTLGIEIRGSNEDLIRSAYCEVNSNECLSAVECFKQPTPPEFEILKGERPVISSPDKVDQEVKSNGMKVQ